MEHTYYLTFRTSKRGGELSFNVGTKHKTTTLLKLGGRRIEDIFNQILKTLSKTGCVTPLQTGNPRMYCIRDDVGPVLGAFLILIKRGQKTEYWLDFLDELLMGKYARLGETFSTFLEFIVDLSKGETLKDRRGDYSLSPAIVSSFSSALKVLVKKLRKYTEMTSS